MQQNEFIEKQMNLLVNRFYSIFSIDYIAFCVSNKTKVNSLISKIEEQLPSFNVFIKGKKQSKQKIGCYDVSVYPFETDYGPFWRFSIMGKNANLFFHTIFFQLSPDFFSNGSITIKRIDIKYSFDLVPEEKERSFEFVRNTHEDFLSNQQLFVKKKNTAFPCLYVQSENKATTYLGLRGQGYFIRFCSTLNYDYMELELKNSSVINLTTAFSNQNKTLFCFYLLEKLFLSSTRFANHKLTEDLLKQLSSFEIDRRAFRLFVFPERKKYRHFKKREEKEKINYIHYYNNKIIFFSDFFLNLPSYPEFFECFNIIVNLYWEFFLGKVLNQSFEDYVTTVTGLNPQNNGGDLVLFREDFFKVKLLLPSFTRFLYGSSRDSKKQKVKKQLGYLSEIPYRPPILKEKMQSFYEKAIINDLVFTKDIGKAESFSFSFNFFIFSNVKQAHYILCDNYWLDFLEYFKENAEKTKITASLTYIFINFSLLLQDKPIYISYNYIFYNKTRYEKRQEILKEFLIFLSFCLEKKLINSYSFDNIFFINQKISFSEFKKHEKKNSKEEKIYINSAFRETFLKNYLKRVKKRRKK